jgi:hypothetical protein
MMNEGVRPQQSAGTTKQASPTEGGGKLPHSTSSRDSFIMTRLQELSADYGCEGSRNVEADSTKVRSAGSLVVSSSTGTL